MRVRARARLRKLCCRELEWWERLSESFTDLLDVTIIGLVLLTKETPIYYKIGTKNSKYQFRRTCSIAIWTWNDSLMGKTSINKHCIRRHEHIHLRYLVLGSVTCQNRRSRRHCLQKFRRVQLVIGFRRPVISPLS